MLSGEGSDDKLKRIGHSLRSSDDLEGWASHGKLKRIGHSLTDFDVVECM